MIRRRVVGRAVVRTAAVGGVAYAAGHHMATKSAEQQYTDAQQNAQIEEMQQQQPVYQQPVYQQPPPPMYQQQAYPPPQDPAPAPSGGITPDDIAQLKQLGQLHESGILTDAEFEAAKQKILGK
ncbi:MAG: SHOCT domain-containing protein [Chloroflexi bacterium]|nr:MAG: SHOCT domain-containing protein [Chloroflexota bacterium]